MAETGLNQNWNRDYDPLTGKYIESDPLLTMTGDQIAWTASRVGRDLGPTMVGRRQGANWRLTRGYLPLYQPYSYATGNPTVYIDPLGLEPEALCDRFTGVWHGACVVCVKTACNIFPGKPACCLVAKDECLGNASEDSKKQEACVLQYAFCLSRVKKPKAPEDP
jgi:hypothetical protein